jgi:hypothetical protein
MSFGGFLQANTQTIVIVGPFVDATDGLTPETGVTLSGADEAELLKHNTAAVTSISGNTWAAVTNCDGYYALTLTASNLDTEGLLTVVVQDDSVCLPVKMTWQVIAQAAWASLISAKDTGFMDVNVKAVSEDTTAADNLESACDNYSATRGLAGTALPAAAADAAGGLIISDAGGLAIDTVASNVAAILADTGSDGVVVAAGSKTGYSLTANTGLGNQTANITGNLSGSVGSVTGAVGSVTGNVGGNVAGSVASVTAGVTLANDAITAAKFDESTAFPLKSADTGATAVARTGADGDTLETLSDQLDGAALETTALAILTDTAEIGAAGAGLTEAGGTGDQLTAVPWNAAWDAEVQSECADAITAAEPIAANITQVNAVTVDGAGTEGDPWGPAA